MILSSGVATDFVCGGNIKVKNQIAQRWFGAKMNELLGLEPNSLDEKLQLKPQAAQK